MGRKGPHRYDRAEYLHFKEKILARTKAWAQSHREQINARRPSRAGIPRSEDRKAYDQAYYRRNRDKRLADVNAWNLANPDKRLNAHLVRDFGLTKDQFDALVVVQKNKCAICGVGPQARKRLHVDHDHATGKIRGLLCLSCNRMLGFAHDDPRVLQAAIQYLARSFVKS